MLFFDRIFFRERVKLLSLFYNYENAGKGVAKNGPRKKPFFRFWEIFARKFWKLFIVNMIYVLFCLPIVTFGPATAAMMHVMRKFYLEKPIFLWHEFVEAFKKNFRQSVGVGIVDAILIALIVYALNFYDIRIQAATNDTGSFVLMAITLALAVYAFIAHFYIYLQIISLKLPMRAIVKNALILSVAGIKTNVIAMLTSLLFITLAVLFFPYSTVALPFIPFAWMGFTITFCSYPVIQKHIINPYYEARGERNPELPEEEESKEEAIFVDRGGSEAEIRRKAPKGKGKIIK